MTKIASLLALLIFSVSAHSENVEQVYIEGGISDKERVPVRQISSIKCVPSLSVDSTGGLRSASVSTCIKSIPSSAPIYSSPSRYSKLENHSSIKDPTIVCSTSTYSTAERSAGTDAYCVVPSSDYVAGSLKSGDENYNLAVEYMDCTVNITPDEPRIASSSDRVVATDLIEGASVISLPIAARGAQTAELPVTNQNSIAIDGAIHVMSVGSFSSYDSPRNSQNPAADVIGTAVVLPYIIAYLSDTSIQAYQSGKALEVLSALYTISGLAHKLSLMNMNPKMRDTAIIRREVFTSFNPVDLHVSLELIRILHIFWLHEETLLIRDKVKADLIVERQVEFLRSIDRGRKQYILDAWESESRFYCPGHPTLYHIVYTRLKQHKATLA